MEDWRFGALEVIILMKRIRFVNFFIDLSTLVYFFRCGHVHASLVKIQGKEVRCHCCQREHRRNHLGLGCLGGK